MKSSSKKQFFERFSEAAVRATGSSSAFIVAVSAVVIWAATGPLFNFSETWQLVINTGTTIVTFLMVFLIQKTQNKDAKAIHLKLNELIAAQEGASNRMVDIEDISEKEMDQLHRFYEKLAEIAKADTDLLQSHSIDAAHEVAENKLKKISNTRKKKAPNEKKAQH